MRGRLALSDATRNISRLSSSLRLAHWNQQVLRETRQTGLAAVHTPMLYVAGPACA